MDAEPRCQAIATAPGAQPVPGDQDSLIRGRGQDPAALAAATAATLSGTFGGREEGPGEVVAGGLRDV